MFKSNETHCQRFLLHGESRKPRNIGKACPGKNIGVQAALRTIFPFSFLREMFFNKSKDLFKSVRTHSQLSLIYGESKTPPNLCIAR